MIDEPEAMKEIYAIRIRHHNEMKGLSFEEKMRLFKKKADEEWSRINKMRVSEEKSEYG